LQGISLSDQGYYPPYQGIRISKRFLGHSEAQKCHFSPILPEIEPFRDATCLAVLQAKPLKKRLFCQKICEHRSNLPSIKRADAIMAI
jgi:hypothetical protein